MTWNLWTAVAALNGMIAVMAGAFGAHALKDKVGPRYLEVFETAARYQMYHALALLAVAWLTSRAATPMLQASGWCFVVGVIIFSGSLYALVLTGVDKLGAITPVGGLLLIIGWLLLVIAGFRTMT